MTDRQARFLQPLDVLFLRGNKAFGDPGSFGESTMPPLPSVAAGALRSRMLVDAGIDPVAFARGDAAHPALGTASTPGEFAVSGLHPARRGPDGTIETLHPLPADLVATETAGRWSVRRLQALAMHDSPLASSAPLHCWPVLADAARGKPVSGLWLTAAGWEACLAGHAPDPSQLVPTGALWQRDERIGVGLDPQRRAAADSQLFTSQAIAMRPGVGLLVEAELPGDCALPEQGLLRFGGDGRAVALEPATPPVMHADLGRLAAAGRLRLVLTTPGLFADGSRLPGMTADGSWAFGGVRGRVVCAALPRPMTVSGWDLAREVPKTAQRAVPAGAVYWIDALDADADALRKLVNRGLWSAPCEDPGRRAEGFNRLALAHW